jgi:hypothetical protein
MPHSKVILIVIPGAAPTPCRAAEAQLEAEVLAEFLGLMRSRKSQEIQGAREELSSLCSDIQAVSRRWSMGKLH